MKSPILFILLVTVHCLSLKVYSQIDYRNEKPFFQDQITVYQDWLKREQLNSFFQFQSEPLKIYENQVTLQLHFMIRGIVASTNGIKQLNDKYEEQTGFKLEEILFQKAVHIFEVEPEELVIRVKSLMLEGEEGPGVDSRLKYKEDYINGGYKLSSFSFYRKAVEDSVVIHNFELPKNLLLPQGMDVNDPAVKRKEREICYSIKLHIEKHFKSKGESYFRYPDLTNTLILEVKNLKHEVIPARLLGLLDPHEKLTITIKIYPYKQGGLRIIAIIDGRFGPGLYKPRSPDYHDMDPTYIHELKDYTSRFLNKYVRNWLVNP